MFDNVSHPWEAIIELAEFNFRWMLTVLVGASIPAVHLMLHIYIMEGKRAAKYGKRKADKGGRKRHCDALVKGA